MFFFVDKYMISFNNVDSFAFNIGIKFSLYFGLNLKIIIFPIRIFTIEKNKRKNKETGNFYANSIFKKFEFVFFFFNVTRKHVSIEIDT